MSNIKYSFNRDYFSVIDSEDKAYFLGLIYADGQNHQEGNYMRLDLQEKDKHILETFINCINGNNKLLFVDKKKENVNWSNCYYLQLNSKKICGDLAKLGCGQNKTLNLNFPNKKQVPDKFIHHFIRGVFDGDGSVWEGKRKLMMVKDKHHSNGERLRIIHNVKFNITGTIDMMVRIQEVLVSELGFNKNKINRSKNIGNCAQLEYSGRGQMKSFYDYIYKDSTTHFYRKREKFENILNKKYDEKTI